MEIPPLKDFYHAVRVIYALCKETDWIYDEVVTEFIKHQKNNPTGSLNDQVQSAFMAAAHK